MPDSSILSNGTAEVCNDFQSSRKRAWFRALAILLGLAPFLLLEVSLRMVLDRGDLSLDPIVEVEQSRSLFERDDQRQLWVIPPSRKNFFQFDSFPIDKPDGSRRVFVLGGSTTQGRPYSIETAFSTWLKLRLQAADPSTQYDVINCGGVSYASYRIEFILDEVLRHQPDAIILYTGHNEFLEEREYQEVRELSEIRRFFSRLGNRLYLVPWLRGLLREPVVNKQTMPSEAETILDEPGGLEKYHRDPAWRRGVERQFRSTFRKMLDRVKEVGVRIVCVSPASDLINTPPFKTEVSPTLSPRELASFQASYRLVRLSELDPDQRIDAARICLSIDPQHAATNYILGRVLFERGEIESARSHLIAARDHDVCPLRATTAIVDTIDEFTKELSIPCVDATTLLDQRDHLGQRSPDGIADAIFFADHVHPTIAGHQRLGEALAKVIESWSWFEPDDDRQRTYERLAEEHLDRLGHEYFERGKQRLEGLRRWTRGK